MPAGGTALTSARDEQVRGRIDLLLREHLQAGLGGAERDFGV